MSEKWVTRFTPSARRDLRAVPRETALRILRKLADLETDPYGYGTTDLVGEPGFRRLRVGTHRVIYSLDHGQVVIWIIAVGHRSTVYDKR